MLDPQAHSFLETLRESGVPSYPELGVAEARRLIDEGTPVLFGEPPEVHRVENGDADGVPVRVYRHEVETPALVYFHGGGWVIGSLDSHHRLCQAIAAESGCAVVSVDYRLAPEHPYPAAVEDAWTATAWAAKRFPRIAVGGDSAGGHLAALTALRARDHDVELALQVLAYPVIDFAFDTPSYLEHDDVRNLPAATMKWFWELFLAGDTTAAPPEVSPLRAASLAGVAPALVTVAEYDPLCDEGKAYAEALAAAGVPVTFHHYDGLIHGFLRMPAVIDRARGAIDEVATALRVALLDGR